MAHAWIISKALLLPVRFLDDVSSGILTAGVDRVTGHRSECSMREAGGERLRIALELQTRAVTAAATTPQCIIE